MSRIQMPPIPNSEDLDANAPRPGNRRQWPRYALPKRNSFIITADGGPGTGGCTCTIEDISLGGARLHMEGTLPGSLEIRIAHPRLGHAFARRCWKAKDRWGVSFDHSESSLAFIADCMADTKEL